MDTTLDLAIIRRFADVAADALAAHREEIDGLNVYPVADADTGTNLYLTAAAARDALHEAGVESGPQALAVYARGALLGARGNSGGILAEMLGAALRRLAGATAHERRALVFAEALGAGSRAAYAAVGEPVEGTMLTVCRMAAEAAAERAADPAALTRDVVAAAADAARTALEHTPEQLDRLAEAGVVDAGGRGVSVLFDAVDRALTGRRPLEAETRLAPAAPVPAGVQADLTEDGPSYEVMFLLDADEAAVAKLRTALSGLGDSLVVVGGEGLWNVHVHVDDVGAAIEAGLEAGRPHRVKVTHFAEQREQREEREREDQRTSLDARRRTAARAVVAVSAGPGLSRLYAEAGAVVLEGRPSTAELAKAITASEAVEVVVLPNDWATMRCAEAAARAVEQDLGIRVAVIPTVAQVQGLAAMAVHDEAAAFDKDVLEMTATARHARHGGVTVADRRALTIGGPCEPGDHLGIVDGEFVRVGGTLEEVAVDVLARLVGAGGELVTIVSGRDDPDGALAEAVAGWVQEHHPTVDVVTYPGGQPRYPLLVAVE